MNKCLGLSNPNEIVILWKNQELNHYVTQGLLVSKNHCNPKTLQNNLKKNELKRNLPSHLSPNQLSYISHKTTLQNNWYKI